MATIGEMNTTPGMSGEFSWTVPAMSCSELCHKKYYSPPFSFAGGSWSLGMEFNSTAPDNPVDFIYLHLQKRSVSPPVGLDVFIRLKILNSKRDFIRVNSSFRKNDVQEVLFRTSLSKNKSKLIYSNVITVICKVKSRKDSSIITTAECSYCKETFPPEIVSLHEQKCLDRPIKCPECSDVVLLEDWNDHECATDGKRDDDSLCQDLKNILLNGKNHDLVLKVGDQTLRAHQDVLRARSLVFESMLNHDMTEKRSGVTDIPDCDPEAMKLFLLYVYCGKVETQDQNNMLGLYYIADKYDMYELKEKCREYTKKALSHTNICQVIQLALTHSDTNLLECATEYFIDNAVDIMLTVEWQSFLKDNTIQGNELLIKSFQKIKKS